MRPSSLFRRVVALALAVSVAMLAMLPAAAAASSRVDASVTVLATSMTGAEEAPGPGDPDGFGAAVLALKPSTGLVCWAYAVKKVEPITAAHIHLAPAGSPGSVVVPLGASGSKGYSIGCTTAATGLVADIAANPTAYYVNVHNAPFPGGALRGQLGD